MYTIQANKSNSKSINITDEHLQTIHRYMLLDNIVDSNGIVDETVVDKVKFNVRALLESDKTADKDLLDLCLDVFYNDKMKAFGLNELIKLYNTWKGKINEDLNILT